MPEETTQPDAMNEDDAPEATQQPSAAEGVDEAAILRAQLAEMNDKYLRALAEAQNIRRRADLSIEQAREQQVMALARDLIKVLDQFDLALNVKAEGATVEAVIVGVRIVHTELLAVLDRMGVRRLDPRTGDPFDPAKHEALMRQKMQGQEPNHVAMVMQPGYTLGDKTVRPAKVAVTE